MASAGVEVVSTHQQKEESPQGEVVHNLPYLKTFRKKLRNNSTPAEATL
ncbi:MAG: hypothetical protein RIA69_02805 [Cyclobacteriaceae bacterium]